MAGFRHTVTFLEHISCWFSLVREVLIAVLFETELHPTYPAKLWPVLVEVPHGRVIQNLEKDARPVKGDTFAVTRAFLNGELASMG